MSRTIAGLVLSDAIAGLLDGAGGAQEVESDIDSIKRGRTTPHDLLKECLELVDDMPEGPERRAQEAAWRGYVKALEPFAPIHFIETMPAWSSGKAHLPLADGLQVLARHIATQGYTDKEFSIKDLRIARTGRITCAPAKPGESGPLGLAYTRKALAHIAELSGVDRPKFWVANVLFCAPYRRGKGSFEELIARAKPRSAVVARLAVTESGSAYLRAVISDKHAGAAGDDATLARILGDMVPSAYAGAAIQVNRFLDGSVSHWSVLLDSMTSKVSARRSMQIVNSETKSASFSVRQGVHLTATGSGVSLPAGLAGTRTTARHLARGDVAQAMSAQVENALCSQIDLTSIIEQRTKTSLPVRSTAVMAVALATRIARYGVGAVAGDDEKTTGPAEEYLRELLDADERHASGIGSIPAETEIRAVAVLSVVALKATLRNRGWLEEVAGELLMQGFRPGELDAARAELERRNAAEAKR